MDESAQYFLYFVAYLTHLVIAYFIISWATQSSALRKNSEAQTKLMARMAKQQGIDAKEVDYLVK